MTNKPVKRKNLDAAWHSAIGQFTGGLSPAALATAYLDWSLHLLGSPDKQAELLNLSQSNPTSIDASEDPRYAHKMWDTFPYNV